MANEFLELKETLRAEEASIGRLFGDNGMSLRRNRSDADGAYMAKLAEAVEFVAQVYDGKRPMYHLKEALGTSDFPYLFGDIIDRQLLARYRETPVSWPRYCRRATVPDFRAVKRFSLDGAESVLPVLPTQGEMTQGSLTDSAYSYAVSVYARKLPIAWQSMVNDDLGAFRDLPDRLARSARRTEEKFATSLYVGSTGPNTAFYTSGNNNIIKAFAGTANPALTMDALQSGMSQMLLLKDTEGEPIAVNRMVLVVPPQLQVTAYNIVNATQIWSKTSGGGTTAQELLLGNWVKNAGIIDVVTAFYIPVIATTNGATSWFLFADPVDNRPAIEMGFLQGFDEPGVFRKVSNIERLGGGVDTRMADFDTLGSMYSIVHVLGGSTIDPKMSLGSNGSGS